MLVVLAVAALLAPATPAVAAHGTYGDYSMMTVRSAGQAWSGGAAATQWAWDPRPDGHWASWGDPATWPPAYRERFLRAGDWVLLDGWADNGTYYRLRVTAEYLGDRYCQGMTPVPTDGGRQHYVRWAVPSTGYCLDAQGTIVEESSGKVVTFRHVQVWYPPASCSNTYHAGRVCLAQRELWWDDNGGPYGKRLDRTNRLARGLGMAFTVRQTYPTTWAADGRYYWRW